MLSVVCDEGEFAFWCGGIHREGGKKVHLQHLLDRDPSLKQCMGLSEGCEAHREQIGAPWIRQSIGGGDDC